MKLKAGAQEFVPRAIANDFPSLASPSPSFHAKLAAKALERRHKGDDVVFAEAAKKPPRHEEECPTPVPCAFSSPPVTVINNPPVPLFVSTVSEGASSKWKGKWMTAARLAYERKQSEKDSTAVTAAAAALAGKQHTAAPVSTSWHGALAPCTATLWSNTSDWKFPDKAPRPAEGRPAWGEKAAAAAAGAGAGAAAATPEEWWASLVSNNVAAVTQILHEHLGVVDDRHTCPLPEHEGLTALMLCAKLGRSQLLSLLLNPPPGAAPSAPAQQLPLSQHRNLDLRERRSKRTALLLAVEHGQVECARLLLRAGASLEVRDRAAETCLHKAARSGSAVVAAWLLSGLDRRGGRLRIDARSKQGLTPLLLCKGRDVASAFLDAGAQAMAINAEGQTILSVAAFAGNHRLLECVLTRHGSSLGALEHRDIRGDSALILAAKSPSAGALACLRALLAASCDVDAAADDGTTALMHAAALGRREMVRLLLAAGATVNLEDAYGGSALVSCIIGRHIELALDLLEGGLERAGLSPRGVRRLLPAHARALEALFEEPEAPFGHVAFFGGDGSGEGTGGEGRGQERGEELHALPRLTFLGAAAAPAAISPSASAREGATHGLDPNLNSNPDPNPNPNPNPSLGPPDLRLVLEGLGEGEDEGEALVIMAHREVLARCGRLEAMFSFQKRQGEGQGREEGQVGGQGQGQGVREVRLTGLYNPNPNPNPNQGVREVRLTGLDGVRRGSIATLVRYLYRSSRSFSGSGSGSGGGSGGGFIEALLADLAESDTPDSAQPSSATWAAAEAAEERLLDLLWLSDEFLLAPLKAEMGAT